MSTQPQQTETIRSAGGPAGSTVEDPALLVDRVSMTFKVPSDREEVSAHLPWYKKAIYGVVRRQPRVSIHALQELSLVVEKGQSLGIVGRNGSGKSTLSKIIAGKLMPTTGEVWSSGVPMMLGVNAALVPAISGRQNIILGGLALGMSREEIEGRLPEIEESTGLGTSINLPIDTYSSGMSARLRFAIATSRNPEVLVIDEALNVGDAQFKDRSQERMQELREQAGCVVLVSHSRKTIAESCSRVLWLDRGIPLADGDPEEVLEAYGRYNFLLAKQRLQEAEDHVMSFRRAYRNAEIRRGG